MHAVILHTSDFQNLNTMSKDAPPGSAGLLSKVARFVRNPATNWGDLDTMSEGRDDVQSKQALKEMIERKRRNDFVRKREFEMLRKLRNKPMVSDQGYGGRPSFFQSSFSSRPDDRAGTLKKINEIEAQMSMHWWKSRHADSRDAQTTLPPEAMQGSRSGAMRKPVAAATASNSPGSASHRSTAPTQPMTTVPSVAGTASKVVTAPSSAITSSAASKPSAASAAVQPAADSGFKPDEMRESTGFSASKFYALDAQELALNPEIEEASIRFASGDDAATEQGLVETLKNRAGGGTVDEWMTLFDFYRATGQSQVFDAKAIEFASRFSRSAPQWFSLPEAVAMRAAKTAVPTSQLDRAAWVADSDVDAHSVMLLNKALERTPQPWVLDWTALRTLLPTAVDPLQKLLTAWASSDVDVRFLGEKVLRDVLHRKTVSGDRSVEQRWWTLRLGLLRVMDMGDEFELTALDFCITYELSPPSWESPRCKFKALQPGAPRTAGAGSGTAPPQFAVTQFLDSGQPEHGPLSMSESGGSALDSALSSFAFQSEEADMPEMTGEVIGEPQEILAELDAQLSSSPVFDISCRYLIRVDFSAAGSILNWVSAHQAVGRQVRFVNVHRLIAAFFHVIGITEYAKVVTCED